MTLKNTILFIIVAFVVAVCVATFEPIDPQTHCTATENPSHNPNVVCF